MSFWNSLSSLTLADIFALSIIRCGSLILLAAHSTGVQKKIQKQYASVSVTFRWAVTFLSLYDTKAHYMLYSCRISSSSFLRSRFHYVLVNSFTQWRAQLNGECFSPGHFMKIQPQLQLQDRRNLTNLYLIIAVIWMLPLDNNYLPNIFLACTLNLALSMFVNLKGNFWKG